MRVLSRKARVRRAMGSIVDNIIYLLIISGAMVGVAYVCELVCTWMGAGRVGLR